MDDCRELGGEVATAAILFQCVACVVLQVNRTLTHLDISASFCHLRGALAIAACLKVQHAVLQ